MTKTLKSQVGKGEDVGVDGFHHVGPDCLGGDSRMICCKSGREVRHFALDSRPKNIEEAVLHLTVKTANCAELAKTLITTSDLRKHL